MAKRSTIPKPTVMIFADASFCPQTKAAGWGAWIKADGREALLIGGQFRDGAKDAGEAETMALANAMHEAKRRGLFDTFNVVMLQSDCINALQCIRYKIPATRHNPSRGGLDVPFGQCGKHQKRWAKPLGIISSITEEFGLKLQVRHIRGHSKGDDGRSWVNRRCDEIAREWMQKDREA